MRVMARILAVVALGVWLAAMPAAQTALDREAERWIEATLKRMTLEQKVGQVLMPSFESMYTPTDSGVFETLAAYIKQFHVGGFIVFGGSQPAPNVLLNPTYPTVTLGQPMAAASLLNRLQRLSQIPLINAADFETGVGMRISGGTLFPRAMAFGAAGDDALTEQAGRIAGVEGRALGVHVNFAPVADVNNNPRNPVINTRSFGEGQVSSMVSAYVRGLSQGGMIATLKHFPGHGDTDVDSHLGLPLIPHARARIEEVELPPFRSGIAGGAGAVMTAHIMMPALEPTPETPVTFSDRIVTGLLRRDLGFEGLIFTDSMGMQAITRLHAPGAAAVRAFNAGHDMILHSPDVPAAHSALLDAARGGQITPERLDGSVRRILRSKARLGLHRSRTVDLERVPDVVGSREHRAVARQVSERAITLIKDERSSVPLLTSRAGSLLFLSVLDYPSGWGIAAPSRTFLPELRKRWSNVAAVELSDRTSPSELELLRAAAGRYDAIIAAVYVRTAAFSGRMDLAPPVASLLRNLVSISAAARSTAQSRDESGQEVNRQRPPGDPASSASTPFVTVFFGNPYQSTFLPELPSVLLTYDFYDVAEATAVRAIAGEIPIGGRLPIGLPGLFPIGHGLTRPAVTSSP